MVTRKPGNRGKTQLTDGFYDALGHTIKVARTDLGIERKDLAAQAGISYSYLAAIEKGQRQPSSQVLISLADALGLRTHELMASAEVRRDRNLSPSGDHPQWLTGQDQMQAMRLEAPPAAMAPAPMESGPETVPFLEEMARLAHSMSQSDKQLLLDMARKLAD